MWLVTRKPRFGLLVTSSHGWDPSTSIQCCNRALGHGPHGGLGPMFPNVLFGHLPLDQLTFKFKHALPNITMYIFPCPLGVVHTDTINWNWCTDRKFNNHIHSTFTFTCGTHSAAIGPWYCKSLVGPSHAKALGKSAPRPHRRTRTGRPSSCYPITSSDSEPHWFLILPPLLL